MPARQFFRLQLFFSFFALKVLFVLTLSMALLIQG